MTTRRVLFYGSLAADADQDDSRRLCTELGIAAVDNGVCIVLAGPGELDCIVAAGVHSECEATGASLDTHLHWMVAQVENPDEVPELHWGRRQVLGDSYAYGSFGGLRTYLLEHVDGIITVGGAKGVRDLLEKSELAGTPSLPIARTGGESRIAWKRAAAAGFDFGNRNQFEQFEDLSNLNLEPSQVAVRVFDVLGSVWARPSARIFIVHGHDGALKYELKDFLQNTLGLGRPVILQDEPSSGRTVIEKFEEYAGDANVAFVLLTPDDLVASAADSNDTRWRGRQNVILELGYFLGKLGRTGGRVLLLHKGDLELPSDISGVVYISVDDGVLAAGETIRRELRDWIQSPVSG